MWSTTVNIYGTIDAPPGEWTAGIRHTYLGCAARYRISPQQWHHSIMFIHYGELAHKPHRGVTRRVLFLLQSKNIRAAKYHWYTIPLDVGSIVGSGFRYFLYILWVFYARKGSLIVPSTFATCYWVAHPLWLPRVVQPGIGIKTPTIGWMDISP